MDTFLTSWGEAASTSVGFFWKAFWAFMLGYAVSSMIQVFVTRARMQRHMGEAGPRSVAIATLFGFISSSCSFAALATTRALFAKGAGIVPSLAFLLASTNLVIELGIVIAVFLGWQFVVGEYVGGVLLILLMWLVVRLTRPKRLLARVRERIGGDEEEEEEVSWRDRITSLEGWRMVARRYFMEWQMVWKDVTIGFTVAGIIAAFVPRSFFQTLFVGAGKASSELAVWEVAVQTLVGPLAAFFTFIGSMGNIPLAAVLYDNGVSFAGVMAFIFSDLVVLPVLRINARYYGWRLALYIVGVFLVALVCTALLLHFGFAALGLLPEAAAGSEGPPDPFAVDYTLFLNLGFLGLSGGFAWLAFGDGGHGHHHGDDGDAVETVLFWLSMAAYVWLAGGLVARFALG